jgi:hypothetical protein
MTRADDMAANNSTSGDHRDPEFYLGAVGRKVAVTAAAIGVGALVLAATLGLATSHDGGRAFLHSYLVAFAWILSVGLGALWWVILQHLVNAKWSIALRRVGELLASNVPVLALLALPVVVPTLMGKTQLYLWADSARMHADHALHHKASYLNLPFFAVRMGLYFGFWFVASRFFLKSSRAQDSGNNPSQLVAKMRTFSAPGMIIFALTLTFCAIDLLMSLDPAWFSTIFGVYYFAGSVIAFHAVLALIMMWLQGKGRLTRLVTTEHFHDVGKMLFAFTVFWAYIAFSQFMLIWYANIPEETAWYRERFSGDWYYLAWGLLFGHFVLPFAGLMSRHVKRSRVGLAFWAIWLLLMHYLDLYWLVVPNLGSHHIALGLVDAACLVGVASLFVASVAWRAAGTQLVALKDPRLASSMAFENM